MDFLELLLQLVIAIFCASLANILIPRQIPGKGIGLVLIRLTGGFIGQWFVNSLHRQSRLSFAILNYEIQGVPIVPSILGSAVVLYLVSTLIGWASSNR